MVFPARCYVRCSIIFFLYATLTRLSTFVWKHQQVTHPHVAENFLSILEGLKRFPGERSDINQWWIPQLGKKPTPLKSSKGSVVDQYQEEEPEIPEGDEDDWRKFFEVSESTEKIKKTGLNQRLYKMTVHQSLHSLQSHRAVFSRAWMILLPRLSQCGDVETTKVLATRVLNLMHGGVMPHLTRPVLIMDWIGSCVDYGIRSLRSCPCDADVLSSKVEQSAC